MHSLVRHEARRAGRVIELTAKEFALLEYLMRHPGQVLTRTQIVDAVWRYDLVAPVLPPQLALQFHGGLCPASLPLPQQGHRHLVAPSVPADA